SAPRHHHPFSFRNFQPPCKSDRLRAVLRLMVCCFCHEVGARMGCRASNPLKGRLFCRSPPQACPLHLARVNETRSTSTEGLTMNVARMWTGLVAAGVRAFGLSVQAQQPPADEAGAQAGPPAPQLQGPPPGADAPAGRRATV